MNKIIALLFILDAFRTHAQASTPVLDWKAPATLPTYLLQQYAPHKTSPCQLNAGYS